MFVAVRLTKNADIDKYNYSGYGIGFDRRGNFSVPGGGFGQNVIIFGAHMSYSDILCDGPTQGLNGTALTAEKIYPFTFTQSKKKFSLRLHYNGANSYLFVNGTGIAKFKAKDSEIAVIQLCLGNILKMIGQ